MYLVNQVTSPDVMVVPETSCMIDWENEIDFVDFVDLGCFMLMPLLHVIKHSLCTLHSSCYFEFK